MWALTCQTTCIESELLSSLLLMVLRKLYLHICSYVLLVNVHMIFVIST